jgi:hypothetical protein
LWGYWTSREKGYDFSGDVVTKNGKELTYDHGELHGQPILTQQVKGSLKNMIFCKDDGYAILQLGEVFNSDYDKVLTPWLHGLLNVVLKRNKPGPLARNIVSASKNWGGRPHDTISVFSTALFNIPQISKFFGLSSSDVDGIDNLAYEIAGLKDSRIEDEEYEEEEYEKEEYEKEEYEKEERESESSADIGVPGDYAVANPMHQWFESQLARVLVSEDEYVGLEDNKDHIRQRAK